MINTKVVNFVGGSGIGKSLMSALIFAELKMNHYKTEYVHEYAKMLVWQKRFEELDNQYSVSTNQYNMINSIYGVVDYIIADSGLITNLFYNRYNKTNVSNIEKTEQMILKKMNEMNNIYIFLERNFEYPFEQAGRIQSEQESIQVDILLKKLLDDLKLPYLSIVSSKNSISKIYEYILKLN